MRNNTHTREDTNEQYHQITKQKDCSNKPTIFEGPFGDKHAAEEKVTLLEKRYPNHSFAVEPSEQIIPQPTDIQQKLENEGLVATVGKAVSQANEWEVTMANSLFVIYNHYDNDISIIIEQKRRDTIPKYEVIRVTRNKDRYQLHLSKHLSAALSTALGYMIGHQERKELL